MSDSKHKAPCVHGKVVILLDGERVISKWEYRLMLTILWLAVISGVLHAIQWALS